MPKKKKTEGEIKLDKEIAKRLMKWAKFNDFDAAWFMNEWNISSRNSIYRILNGGTSCFGEKDIWFVKNYPKAMFWIITGKGKMPFLDEDQSQQNDIKASTLEAVTKTLLTNIESLQNENEKLKNENNQLMEEKEILTNQINSLKQEVQTWLTIKEQQENLDKKKK